MKKGLFITAFILAGLMFSGTVAFADGDDDECSDDGVKTAVENLRKGKEAEKAGNLFYAYLYYVRDWCATEAARNEVGEGRKRIAKAMAKKAEAKGLLYSKADIFNKTPDSTCEKAYEYHKTHAEDLPTGMIDPEYDNPHLKNKPPGYCDYEYKVSFNDNASAFSWYEGHGLFAEADGAVMKYVRKTPEDYRTVNSAAEHFSERKSRSRTGKEDGRGEYKLDTAYVEELTGIARKNAAKELEEEKRVYNKVADVMTEGLSSEALAKAREWTLIFNDPLLKTVDDTAIKRGEEVFSTQGDAPTTFMRVLRYYDIAERKDKEKTVREKAEKLGDKAEKAGEFQLALEYYGISGNKAKVDSVKPKAEAENKKKGGEAAKKSKDSVDKMMKKDTDKKKFKKGADDLEKELGL